MAVEPEKLFPEQLKEHYEKCLGGLTKLVEFYKSREEKALKSFRYEKKRGAIPDVVVGEKKKYISLRRERKICEAALKHLQRSIDELKKKEEMTIF